MLVGRVLRWRPTLPFLYLEGLPILLLLRWAAPSPVQLFLRFELFFKIWLFFPFLLSLFLLLYPLLNQVLHGRILEITPADGFPDWLPLVISEKTLLVPQLSEFTHDLGGRDVFEPVFVEFGWMRLVLGHEFVDFYLFLPLSLAVIVLHDTNI